MFLFPTFNAVGGEEHDVLGLQRVVVGKVRSTGLWLRFTGQRGVVHLRRRSADC